VTAEVSPSSFPQIVDWAIRRQECGRALVAPHDHFEEVLDGGVRQLPHTKDIDEQQRHGGESGQIVFPGAVEGRVGLWSANIRSDPKCCRNSGYGPVRARCRRASPIAQVSSAQTLKRDSVGSHDVRVDRLGRSNQPGVVLAYPT
jgi:hypothetical protein